MSKEKTQDLLAKLHGARAHIQAGRSYVCDGLALDGGDLHTVIDCAVTLLKAMGDDALTWHRLQQTIDALDSITEAQ